MINIQRKKLILLVLTLAGGLFVMNLAAQEAVGKTLRVKLTYSGVGEVGESAPIHLYLFDSPEFTSGTVMPIVVESSTENGGVIEVKGLTDKEVYAVAAYGDFPAHSGPPPSGTPVGVYLPAGAMGVEPILLDQDSIEIDFQFNDTIRIP